MPIAMKRDYHAFDRAVCGFFGIATCKSGDGPESGLFQARIIEDCRQRRASAVRERVGSGLAIVDDESLDGHGLHRMVDDAD
jgi:hypothetical protein